MALRLAAVAALIAAVAAECPSACSGAGECGDKDQCKCWNGFFGSDCSLRVCPYDKAFVDAPAGDLNHDGRVGYGTLPRYASKVYSKVQYAQYKQAESWPTLANAGKFVYRTLAGGVADMSDIDPQGVSATDATARTLGGWAAQPGEAHFLAECSGKGSCDRSSGACKCADGYTGAACQRTLCPRNCNGRGRCASVYDVASKALTASSGGVTAAFSYALWDAHKNFACVCDAGWTGADCSMRACPAGRDPLVTAESACGNQPCANAKQAFSVDGGQGNALVAPGTYYLEFTDAGRTLRTGEFELYTDSTVADWQTKKAANEAAVKYALESLPNNATGHVAVTSAMTDYGLGGATAREQLRIRVEFRSRAGAVAPMRLRWAGTSNAATRGAFVFQPSQPVQALKLTPLAGAGNEKVQFKIFLLDQSEAGRPEYSEGAVTDLGAALSSLTASQLPSVADAIADGLNSIPYIKYRYGKPFVRDSTVLVSQEGAAGSDLVVKIAFPGLDAGKNKLQLKFSKNAAAMGDFSSSDVTPLGDVAEATAETHTCSNRGLCDSSTGQCKCFAGYTGNLCGLQSAIAKGSATSMAE